MLFSTPHPSLYPLPWHCSGLGVCSILPHDSGLSLWLALNRGILTSVMPPKQRSSAYIFLLVLLLLHDCPKKMPGWLAVEWDILSRAELFQTSQLRPCEIGQWPASPKFESMPSWGPNCAAKPDLKQQHRLLSKMKSYLLLVWVCHVHLL